MAAIASVKTIATWACRLLLGGTFAYAALLKLADPSAFATDIGHYRLVPYPLTLAASIYLPWLELLCGTAVLIRRFERGALVLLLGLCVLFSVALTSAWFRGLDIECGCFGSASIPAAVPVALARSLALGLIAFFLLRRSRSTNACANRDQVTR